MRHERCQEGKQEWTTRVDAQKEDTLCQSGKKKSEKKMERKWKGKENGIGKKMERKCK